MTGTKMVQASSLLALVMLCLATHTLGLEVTLTRQMHLAKPGDTCGNVKCIVEGDSVTIDAVTLTRLKGPGETFKLLTIDLSSPDNEVHFDNMHCNGTLEKNLATIHANQRNASGCDSDLFICNVTYTQGAGQVKSASAAIGPGDLPQFHPGVETHVIHAGKKPGSASGTGSGSAGSVTHVVSSNVHPSEVWLWGEKITKVEYKLQTLGDRLDEKLTTATDAVSKRAGDLENTVLQRVASVETDISTRVSRLEDRLAAILLSGSHSPADGSADLSAESFKDLERDVKTVKALVTNGGNNSGAGQPHVHHHDQPASCERGMGNDVTRAFPPYVTMTLDSLQREVLCDTHTDGGGWIVIQRRTVGDVDFYRDWTSYREGFGSPTGDFWMGNEAVHKLTDREAYELRVVTRHKGQDLFADYSSFRIEDEAQKYRLHLGAYSGTAGDGLTFHNAMAFSTFDRDSDTHATLNCAIHEHGAWWYKNCIHSNLNGKWGVKVTPGVSWYTGSAWTLPYFSEMKIRRVKSNGKTW